MDDYALLFVFGEAESAQFRVNRLETHEQSPALRFGENEHIHVQCGQWFAMETRSRGAADRVTTQRAVGDKLLEDLADFLHFDFKRSRATASVIAFSKRANFSATGSPRIASRHAGFSRSALIVESTGIFNHGHHVYANASFLLTTFPPFVFCLLNPKLLPFDSDYFPTLA